VASETGSDEEFAALLRQKVCDAFGVKPWEIGIGPAPWHVRLLAPLRWRWWWWRIRRTWYRLRERLTEQESAGEDW
jgi:hypothetical protein